MKKTFSIAAYLLICGLVIATAIYAGQKRHDNCRECKLALEKTGIESGKFAGTCK